MKRKLILDIIKLSDKAKERGIYSFGIFEIRPKDMTDDILKLETISDLKKIIREYKDLFNKNTQTRVEKNSFYNGFGEF